MTASPLAVEVRREIVGLLSARGMSNRAIAPAIGASEPTVRRDVQQVRHRDAPDPAPQFPDHFDSAEEEAAPSTHWARP